MNLFDVYPLFNIEIVQGKGCHVWNSEGNEYLDLYGGHTTISVEHSHPAYIKAVTGQANRLGFYPNSVVNNLQQKLADKLGKAPGYDDYSSFLIDSGAEANENALKLASLHNSKERAITFKRAFHGRASVAVRVTGSPKIVVPVDEDLVVTYLPLNDASAVEEKLKRGNISSMVIGGAQGVGGIQLPTDDSMRELCNLCTTYDACLILDEIQSGYGRSGKFFAHQCAGIKLDLISIAKGIANDFLVSGLSISPKFKSVYDMLGATFGGNHSACVAATAVLDIMKDERLIDNAARVGAYLLEELYKLPDIKEIRSRGLMIGIGFEESIKGVRSKPLFEEKAFIDVVGTHMTRLFPLLRLTMDEVKKFIHRFKEVLST